MTEVDLDDGVGVFASMNAMQGLEPGRWPNTPCA
jgi:hypothetical protein